MKEVQFVFEIHAPPAYPFKPLQITLLTKVYHPYIKYRKNTQKYGRNIAIIGCCLNYDLGEFAWSPSIILLITKRNYVWMIVNVLMKKSEN